jgi:EAL domain-containing protein (putative c-di-GMP-specific phosphodiesterase class I)
MGVSVAIDDFGTGYSSLSYLKQFPVQELKIDRAFVREIATDEDDLAIVRATIELGHALGLEVIAEGVEDEASYRILADLGCDAAQGYHLGRPQPAAEIAAGGRRFRPARRPRSSRSRAARPQVGRTPLQDVDSPGLAGRGLATNGRRAPD